MIYTHIKGLRALSSAASGAPCDMAASSLSCTGPYSLSCTGRCHCMQPAASTWLVCDAEGLSALLFRDQVIGFCTECCSTVPAASSEPPAACKVTLAAPQAGPTTALPTCWPGASMQRYALDCTSCCCRSYSAPGASSCSAPQLQPAPACARVQCLKKVCAMMRGSISVASAHSLTGRAAALILPQLMTASSGRAPLSLPSNSCNAHSATLSSLHQAAVPAAITPVANTALGAHILAVRAPSH